MMSRNRHMRKSALTNRRREMRKDVKTAIRKAKVATVRSKAVAENFGYEPNLLTERTVEQLRERAKSLGMSGYSKLKKADLVALIERKEGR